MPPHETHQKPVLQQSIDDLKRKLLLWILAMAWLGTIPGWAVKESLGQSSAALRVIFALNAVFHPVMFLLLWKRHVQQRTAELCCLLFAAIVCAGCMALSLYSTRYGASMDLEPLYLWIPLIYVLVFALFDRQTSIRLSLAMMTLFFVVSLPYLVRPAHIHTVFTITLHIVSAALVAALYFFSSYQHQVQIAELNMEQLARLANTDALTGLANRRRISEVIEAELIRYARYGHHFAVILLDIDHFKAINDRLGHDVGDEVLKALALRCSALFRDVDLIGRWGGEEFLVVMPETPYPQALQRARVLCEQIAASPIFNDHVISISCGVASVEAQDNLRELFHRADTALYEAKRNGRNCAVGASPETLPSPAVAP